MAGGSGCPGCRSPRLERHQAAAHLLRAGPALAFMHVEWFSALVEGKLTASLLPMSSSNGLSLLGDTCQLSQPQSGTSTGLRNSNAQHET